MYKVAVVQNESEILRSGYANVAQNLQSLRGLSHYTFQAFDGTTIENLFADGPDGLMSFDSIFISTNATSDDRTLHRLVENHGKLDEFLRQGRGIFLSYQKKMCLKAGVKREDQTLACVLPGIYSVAMIERPADEEDSGSGDIVFVENVSAAPRSVGGRVIFAYPETVTEEITRQHCVQNDFKRHLYRSYLDEESDAVFEPLIVDTSYPQPPFRRLLSVNRTSRAGERVLVSTIAVDWEFHARLLTNILTYITEGAPRVAFIDHGNPSNGEFEYIVSAARLSKLPHGRYTGVDKIPPQLHEVHNTYVFSPGWPQAEVRSFWAGIGRRDVVRTSAASDFRRLYQLGQEEAGIVGLTRYANYSSVDLTINAVLLWLESQFDGRLWRGGFWNTHDVLLMMDALNYDISPYLGPVLKDIKGHYRAGAYDGVMGPTCGLLTMVSQLKSKYSDELAAAGFGAETRAEMASWVVGNFEAQSVVSRQVAGLAVSARGSDASHSEWSPDLLELVEKLRTSVRSSLELDPQRILGYSELDLCRLLAICLQYDNTDAWVTQICDALYRLQEPTGRWVSVVRTATVLVVLLEHLPQLRSVTRDEDLLQSMLYSGVQYLRGTYDERSSSWDLNIQTTAKAVHALGLYNREFQFSTQEFFETIRSESTTTNRAIETQGAREDIARLLRRDLDNRGKLETLGAEVAAMSEEKRKAEARAGRVFQQLKWNRAGAVTSTLLLLAVLVSLASSYQDTLTSLFSDLGSALPLIIGAIIAVPVTLWYAPRKPD